MKSEVFNQSRCAVLRAANLYYMEGCSQKEIAERLAVSVPTVSRLLKRAKEEGLISFVIPSPYRECLALETQLRESYGLEEVIVVPPDPEGDRDPMAVKRAVALEGARYIQRVIRPHDILGVAWGGTMYELIQYLNPCQRTEATFVTLHGSITCCSGKFEVNTLVRRIAMAFGGRQYALAAPGLLESPQQLSALRRQRDIAHIFSLFEQITISASGIGSFFPQPTSPLSHLPYLSEEEFASLSAHHPYGDIMLRFFDQNGAGCASELAAHPLAIDMETYRKIPHKLIVASGFEKAYTLQAALRGSLADVLVLDYALALTLAQLDKVYPDIGSGAP